MFINTTGAIIKTVVNTKHFTRILRINFSQISLFLYIHFFRLSPDATRTQCLARTCTRQFRLCPVSITVSLVHTEHILLLAAATPTARQPKDLQPPLAAGHWVIKHCITSRMYGTLPDDAIRLFLSRMYEKSLVVEYTGMFYLFLARHLLLSVPLNWRSGRCDIRGIAGCILLGAAASCYNMM